MSALPGPRVVRLGRQRTLDVFPRCERCGTVLRQHQRRFCSHACRQYAFRWQKLLADYWTDVREVEA